jgi:class 3 adenylate cyclase
MATLRATVIMKTDLKGSTPRFRALSESDLSTVLATHQQLVADVAAKHQGEVVKPEGDAFWIVFPSVTAACLAGLDMQDELRLSQPGKGDDRLAMRIIITLGDVQIEEGALVGDPVVLAARIESVTPPDEIYLSLAAWLAVRSAEVQTSFVGAFSMKGFDEPAPLYRVESSHRTRVFEDQYLVVSDLKAFGIFIESHPLSTIERVLDNLLDVTERVCREFDGTTRFSTGDSYCLTFTDPNRAMTAVERLHDVWEAFDERESLGCPLKIAVHKGTLNAYRSYVYGRDVEISFSAVGAMREPGVYVTDPVRDDLARTPWETRLRLVRDQRQSPRLRLQGVGIYRLVSQT